MPSIFSCFKDGFSCRKKKKKDKSAVADGTSAAVGVQEPLLAASNANATNKEASQGIKTTSTTSNNDTTTKPGDTVPTTGTNGSAGKCEGNGSLAASIDVNKASPKLNGHAKKSSETANQIVGGTESSQTTKSQQEEEPTQEPSEPEVKTYIPPDFKVDQDFLKRFFEHHKSGVSELQIFNKLLDEFSAKGYIQISQVVTGPGHAPQHRTSIDLSPPDGPAFVGNSSRKLDSKSKASKEMVDWLRTKQPPQEPQQAKAAAQVDKKSVSVTIEETNFVDVYGVYKTISLDTTLSKGELFEKLLDVGKQFVRLESIKKPSGTRLVLSNEGYTFVAPEGMASKPKELIGKMLFPLLGQGKQPPPGKPGNLDKLLKLYKAACNPPKEPSNLIQSLKDKSPQDIKINVHTSGPSHEPIHYTEVIIVPSDVRFKAAAKNKSESKSLATREAVAYLESCAAQKQQTSHNQNLKTQKSFKESSATNGHRRKSSTPVDENAPIDSRTSQTIYEAVHKRWKEIAENLSKDVDGFERIAAFVAVSSKDVANPQVLALGISGLQPLAEKLSTDGNAVHDCTAEVIARRSLLCLLYDNLLRLLENQNRDKPEFILQRAPNGSKGYRLKSHLKLYLFLNSPPTGSAALSTGADKSKDCDKLHVQTLSNPKGEAFQVVTSDKAASGTEVIKKPALMSGSDKIAAWNVLGLQGSLLSAFIEPLYLDGVVVSDNFEAGSLKRALFDRVDEAVLDGKLGSAAFRLNRHQVGSYRPANHDQMLGKTATSYTPITLNWYQALTRNGRKPELINTQHGTIHESREPSRLCKHKLAKRYQQLVSGAGVQGNRKLSTALIPPESPCAPDQAATKQLTDLKLAGTYRALKDKCTHYVKAKDALLATFTESGLGPWVRVSTHVDPFSIE